MRKQSLILQDRDFTLFAQADMGCLRRNKIHSSYPFWL